jgi:hypothetical protein
MEHYRAEYMVDGTPTGTIEKWLNATYELRSFGKARPFSTKEQSTEKTSVLCSQLDCHRGRNGVKGQDERRTTAPLTPSRPLPESFCLRSRKSDLTEADVVIHGLSSAVPTGLEANPFPTASSLVRRSTSQRERERGRRLGCLGSDTHSSLYRTRCKSVGRRRLNHARSLRSDCRRWGG